MIKNKKGFTLIELIIVMAIIGILAVVAVVAIGSKSVDARDARRLADMSAVRTALALHCAEPVNAAGTDQTDTFIEEDVAATLHILSAIGTASTATTYIDFSTINDPNGTGTCTNGTLSAVCNYTFGAALDGAAFGTDDALNDIDACDYRINFYQEGGDDEGYAADEGLVE